MFFLKLTNKVLLLSFFLYFSCIQTRILLFCGVGDLVNIEIDLIEKDCLFQVLLPDLLDIFKNFTCAFVKCLKVVEKYVLNS